MKRLSQLFGLFGLLLLAACGGGGGGGDGGGGDGGGGGGTPPPAPLATGTFTKQFGVTHSANSIFPFDGSRDTKTQHLYYASEIGGSGKITRLRLRQSDATATAVTCPNMTVKMGHTNLTVLGTTWASNVQTGQGSELTVINNATITIPAAPINSWIDIPLATPFDYNGVDNLVVDFERTTRCTANVLITTFTAAGARRTFIATVDNIPGTAEYNATAGIVDTDQNWMQFVFAGGDNGVDTVASPNPNAAPLSANVNYHRVQMLYNASSINGAGPLTGVSLQVAGLTTAQTYTYTMKIGHTSLADLGLTWANNFNLGAPVTVAQSLSFAVPAGVPNGEWVWLPMPGGVFTYNGTDNLVIELTVETASGSVGLFTHPTANVNRIYGNPASASASTLNSYAHQIKLRFHGATVNVLPPGSYIAIAYPFSSVVNPKQQYLYRAAELGSPGTITGMACRLGTATTLATNYPNFEVVLGHTTANTLAGTFASNMVDATTVYSGTFAMPAGLRAGDWIEIPFATPFVYDGVRNLVAQMASDAGTNIHHCSARGPDATLFASRWLSTDNRTSPTGIAGGYLQDLKLRVTR